MSPKLEQFLRRPFQWNVLEGKKITSELIAEAGRIIQEGAEPIEDTRGSAAYKKKALSVILRRALREALQKADY